MSLLKRIRTFQLTTTGLRIIGMLFLSAATYGIMLQTKLIGTGYMTNTHLLNLLEENPDVMAGITLSLVMQLIGTCALPIFVFLLVEGAIHTSNYGKYILRVLGLAVVCQLPYNMITTGSTMYMTRLNPVFFFFLCLIMLYFFRSFSQRTAKHILIKVIAFIGVYLWSNMLGVEHGACCVILCFVMWALRGKQNLQTFIGILVMFLCCIFSVFYMAGLIGFLALHFYEGNKGEENRLVNYLAYPVILMACGLMMGLM